MCMCIYLKDEVKENFLLNRKSLFYYILYIEKIENRKKKEKNDKLKENFSIYNSLLFLLFSFLLMASILQQQKQRVFILDINFVIFTRL